MNQGVGKSVFVLGLAVLALGFSVYVPFWEGAVVNFTDVPLILQEIMQIGFVILFFAGLVWVIGNE